MSNLSFKKLIIIFIFQVLLFHTIKLCFCNDDLNVTCNEIEKNALLEFKSNISDPSGRLFSWIGEDCCKWIGVSCNTKTRHVVRIDLHRSLLDSYLGGKISPSLLHLKYLNYLDLSGNNFRGDQIPNFFGSFENLRYLNLSYASFGGSIPQSLGNLLKLQYLDLAAYRLSGNDIHWVSRLWSLKYLGMGGVDLSGAASYWLQAISSLPDLIELHLPSCKLTNLPPSLPSFNFTALSILDLSNNGFSSTIPQWLFNLTSLKQLNLWNNRLRGVLPDASKLTALEIIDVSQNNDIEGELLTLGKLCNLKVLVLRANKFTGNLTGLVDNLLECPGNSLETLDLRYNELTGNIPDNLGQLFSLVSCHLSGNLWEGTITEGLLTNLSNLEELSIGTTSSKPTILALNISSDWVPPFKLKFIVIQSCQLGPKFPKWLNNQTELTQLVLNDVKISDTIPDWFVELNLELRVLDLSFNQLRGQVPNSFKFVQNSNVVLSSNLFEGPFPLWSSNVSTLYLRDNLFSGPIPQDIGFKMTDLLYLDISGNNFNGSIPMSLRNLDLVALIVSRNRLTGNIPNIWEELSSLFAIDMSDNSLSGSIPSSMGSLNSLFGLTLSGNNLQGELPSSLRNCTNMYMLDLGDNNISGNFPAWIGENMTSLRVLRLRNNSLTGNFPLQLCNLSSLHILDLSKNRLSGPIPSCIGNLMALRRASNIVDFMRYITYYPTSVSVVAGGRTLSYGSTLYLFNSVDLSDNELSGEIPANVTRLLDLRTLNLSMNNLTGRIPLDIGSLKMLETLDLSMNDLRGPIPASMVNLIFLRHLNLSYNNLSGHIPTSNQFQSLNDPSIYWGNDGLCGSLLETKCTNETSSVSRNGGTTKNDDADDDDLQKLLFFVVAGLGFFLGFWGVCGTLAINKNLRDAYFNLLQKMKDKIY